MGAGTVNRTPDVPWHGPWQGHAGLDRFFSLLGEAVEFRAFEPRRFLSSDSDVAALVHVAYKVRATGKVVDELQVHWWTLSGGKVTALRHHEDTAQVVAAVHPR
jgi:ketosteroid isomerase-like protein